ncbi:MAG: ABC transporter permease [Candidatus Izemoplasmataceae bacterium]
MNPTRATRKTNEIGQVIVTGLPKKPFKTRFAKDFKKYRVMYLIFLPVLAYFFIFNYIPMYGITIAFKDYSVVKGIFGSEWVGLDNFRELFEGEDFINVLRNTTAMAMMNLIAGFSASIIFAILLSEIRSKKYKRFVQISSYVPHFIATMVIAQLAIEFFDYEGAITKLMMLFGFEQQNWFANPKLPVFWLINTFIDTWQNFGYGAIVFLAAISNVDPTLHEAAAIDGASRWDRIRYITFPSIVPVIITMLVIRIGLIFILGFDKILLLYKPITYVTADVIRTYTYRMAFGTFVDYSLAAASGFFQSLIGFVLLAVSYGIQGKMRSKD